MPNQNSTKIEKTKCVNPATAEIIGYSEIDSVAAVHQKIQKARQAFSSWSNLTIKERINYLRPLKKYLVNNADEIATTISNNNGKTRIDAIASEVLHASIALDYYCRKAPRFLKPKRVAAGNITFFYKHGKIFRVPYGVVAIISPWNYPLSIPFSEIAYDLTDHA